MDSTNELKSLNEMISLILFSHVPRTSRDIFRRFPFFSFPIFYILINACFLSNGHFYEINLEKSGWAEDMEVSPGIISLLLDSSSCSRFNGAGYLLFLEFLPRARRVSNFAFAFTFSLGFAFASKILHPAARVGSIQACEKEKPTAREREEPYEERHNRVLSLLLSLSSLFVSHSAGRGTDPEAKARPWVRASIPWKGNSRHPVRPNSSSRILSIEREREREREREGKKKKTFAGDPSNRYEEKNGCYVARSISLLMGDDFFARALALSPRYSDSPCRCCYLSTIEILTHPVSLTFNARSQFRGFLATFRVCRKARRRSVSFHVLVEMKREHFKRKERFFTLRRCNYIWRSLWRF